MTDWFLLSTKEEKEKGKIFVFLVDDVALDALKTVNYVVHVGLIKSTVLLVSGKTREDDKSATSQSPPQ